MPSSNGLFSRVRQFGYEVEYPIIYEDSRKFLSLDTMRRYQVHDDGKASEFTIPLPLTLPLLKDEIRHLYGIFGCLLSDGAPIMDENADGDYFGRIKGYDSNGNGIHIRLDITDWTGEEALRYSCLFCVCMERFPGFAKWMERGFRRGWQNWNQPCDLDFQDYCIRHYQVQGKCRNLKYEFHRYGNAITLENRCFGVPRRAKEAIAEIAFIERLCGIVDRSFSIKPASSIDGVSQTDLPALMAEAWKQDKTYEKRRKAVEGKKGAR